MKIIAAFLTLLGSFALVQSLAQTPAPKSPQPAQAAKSELQDDDVIRIKSNLVQVDAVVLDSHGRQVSNLTASDFEILEDGKLRTPEHFSYVSLVGATQDPAAVSTMGQQPGRVFVFVVSNPIIEIAFSFPSRGGGPPISGSSNSQVRAIRAADATKSLLSWFVDSEMNDGDLVAVADLDVNIGVLSSFTNDRAVLRAAIKQVRENVANGNSPPIRIMSVSGDLSLQSLVKYNLHTMETLENVIGQVEMLPGRKVVTLVARGMLYNPRLPYAQVIIERMTKLIERANRAQIAIYTVQARDLNPRGGDYGDDGLIDLAKQTGGRAIYNTNDLRVGFEQIVEESRGYYLLAYNPGAEASIRPHHLQVRVKRPGLKVLNRAQAYARSSKPNQQSMRHPLESPIASRDIEMSLQPSLVAKGNGSRMQLTWRIDLAHVETSTQPDSSLNFSLDLSVRVTGPDGRMFKQTDKNTNFDVNQSGLDAVRQEGLSSSFGFELTKPGFYRISVAARDTNSGKLGRLTRFIEVGKNGTLIKGKEGSR
jgi:VWFA-related protein